MNAPLAPLGTPQSGAPPWPVLTSGPTTRTSRADALLIGPGGDASRVSSTRHGGTVNVFAATGGGRNRNWAIVVVTPGPAYWPVTHTADKSSGSAAALKYDP